MQDNHIYTALSRRDAAEQSLEIKWDAAFDEVMDTLRNDPTDIISGYEIMDNAYEKGHDTRRFAERLIEAAFKAGTARTDAEKQHAKDLSKDVIYDVAAFVADKRMG